MTSKERIEAYFDNELSATESESLLRDIESDPSLKSEFEFQQSVIDGIKEYRKQELITRLNKIEVASVGQSTLIKIIGSLVAASIITGGIFWYTASDNENISEDNIGNQEVVIDDTTEEEQVAEPTEEVAEIIEETQVAENSTTKDSEEPKEQVTQKVDKSVPEVNIPEMVEPDSDSSSSIEDNHDAPEAMSSEAISVTSRADVEVKLSKKYNFHYQVVKGDLTLYGDFDDSKFEVIELKTNKGLNLYLFYKNFYYDLREDSEEIRPLVAVESKELISELNKRR